MLAVAVVVMAVLSRYASDELGSGDFGFEPSRLLAVNSAADAGDCSTLDAERAELATEAAELRDQGRDVDGLLDHIGELRRRAGC